MLRKLKDNTGSGLIWAMAVGSFLLLIVAGTLTIAYSYNLRSLKNNDARQVYLTARSGADLIVAEFTSGSTTAASIYGYLEENGTWTVDDVAFREEMGQCALTVVLDEPEDADTTKRTIQVQSTATLNGKSQTVIATVIGVIEREGEDDPLPDDDETETTDETELTWYLSSYSDGGEEAME